MSGSTPRESKYQTFLLATITALMGAIVTGGGAWAWSMHENSTRNTTELATMAANMKSVSRLLDKHEAEIDRNTADIARREGNAFKAAQGIALSERVVEQAGITKSNAQQITRLVQEVKEIQSTTRELQRQIRGIKQ